MTIINKIIVAGVFLPLMVVLAYAVASPAFATSQITLSGTNLSASSSFRTIASGEGLNLGAYNHFGNTTDVAAKLCALTEKYYTQLGLDKPYTAFIQKTSYQYTSCGNDHNYVWNSGYWTIENACNTGSYLGTVTCGSTVTPPTAVACSANAQCGTDGITGSSFCQGNAVYKNYKTYTCNNPGTSLSSCTSVVTPQLQNACSGNQTCSNGSCSSVAVACSSNSQCGADGITGSSFCQGNGVYKNYKTYTCNNPGTSLSSCSSAMIPQLQTTCLGNQICSSGSCSSTCTANYQQRCVGNSMYWYDSCGTQGSYIGTCGTNCTANYQQQCIGNNLYWYDSCGTQGALIQYCVNGCSGNSCLNYNNTCTYHSYQRCNGNNLYWYDSCGTVQDLAQYCSSGCYNNTCQNNNYNNYYGNCTYHAYKLCTGNYSYWYDSCGNQQDLYTSCGGGQTCQYGQCANYIINPVLPPVQPINNTYITYYRTACSGNSVHWFSSTGADTGTYRNCSDSNSCTIDSCSGSKCSNILKCDGSTCATGSADYNSYCATSTQARCGNGLCESTLGETNSSCPADCKINTNTNPNGLAVSFFTKQDPASAQWQKTAQVGPNGQIYFMVTVTNNSATQADNVMISANIPSEITSLGNLQIAGIPVSGDIVSGINVGSIAPYNTKPVTFEGKTQNFTSTSVKQAMATSNSSGNLQSDSVSINLNPNQATASVSSATQTSGFWEFLKRWYLWILVALVLISLFFIVFRRLSSET